VLELKDVSFAYPGDSKVLSDVSLRLERGSLLGVTGGNGSGKTTLAHLMCGLINPLAGEVLVDGLSTGDPASIYEVRRRVGLVFQDPDEQLVETTVEREIGFGPRNLGLKPSEVDGRVDHALEVFGISRLRRRSCHLLSAGEKQTVTVASVFAMEPHYVILDESTSLLDAESRLHLVAAVDRLVTQTGAGLVFISMRLEDLWMCDRVVGLGGGSVEFDGAREDLVLRLASGRLHLSGLAHILAGMEDCLAGFRHRIASLDTLSADSVYGVIAEMTGCEGGGAACP
jgi:energy-coupling factor transport system ATP-binding protein